MIEDARRIPPDTELPCDLCIVGAGPAGITLALKLADWGRSVILLEAGGRNKSGKSLDLYQGELLDPASHLPLDSDRYRQLGGTSGLCGGRCIPYDEIDFEYRDYVPHSGWPINRGDLDPYYRRAHVYCECGDYEYCAARALPDGDHALVPGIEDGDISTETLERWSPPTHFGRRYRQRLESASNIRVMLHAVCQRVVASADGRPVTGIEVATFAGNRFFIRWRQTVLAGGGLEVTRLLLAANRVDGAGFGNQSGWLGRGYMGHVTGVIARVRFRADLPILFGYEKDHAGVYCRRRFWVSPQAQRRHRLLNIHMLLDRALLGDAEHRSGLMSLAFLAKTMVGKPQSTNTVGRGKYGLYWRHLCNVLAGSPEILSVLPRWSRSRFLQGRRIPSLLVPFQLVWNGTSLVGTALVAPRNNVFHIHYQSEQAPNHASRVSLADECDQFGVPRLRVDFRIREQDVDSIHRAHLLLDKTLRDRGLGQLIFDTEDVPALIRQQKATLGHHIGTARMAGRPEDGVVDADCRVFGTDNLFVASSAVFPTSSQANPTLTIVAMAIRLADHLKTRHESSSVTSTLLAAAG